MIRKMAAVNFYIRHLNPANLQQGDSLDLYNADQHESKTLVLANPPFGAERDKPAYANVWEDYPKESETTILFVKMMLDMLKPGGRCAVVVSEGFLTWEQGSAKALRKMLLQENNLKAVIGLPQGVFVSKGGQGPKTSILLFEKGTPTEKVWFYNVDNDGYSKGTNRTVIADCQLVEVLDLYQRYVKQGQTPPETRRSFSLDVEWLNVVDPRIKAKIRAEVREKMTHKQNEAKEKLMTRLDKKREAAKTAKPGSQAALFDDAAYQTELQQFAQTWEHKTQTEIALAIDKAHLYSFNSANYRSTLADNQLNEWDDLVQHHKPDSNGHSLDHRYAALQQSSLPDAIKCIAHFDPKNAIEANIVREYVGAIPAHELALHPELVKLDTIFKSGMKYQRIKLEKLITPKFVKIKKEEYQGDLDIVEKISFSDGKVHFRHERSTGMDLYRAREGDLVTSKINVHQGAVAIAPCDLVCSTHYQVYEINQDLVNARFLINILRSTKFIESIANDKNKGIKNEQGADFLNGFDIPLPSIGVQNEFVHKIEQQQAIIDGAEKILKNVEFDIQVFENLPLEPIGKAVIDTKNGWSPRCHGGETKVLSLSCLKNGSIDIDEVKLTDEYRNDIEKFYIKEGDFFYSRGNTKELVALSAIVREISDNIVFPDLLTRVKFDQNLILPEYAIVLFNSKLGRDYFGNVPQGSSPTMVKVSQEYMQNFMVPLLGEKEAQEKIVNIYKRYLSVVTEVSWIKNQSISKINKIVESIWKSS